MFCEITLFRWLPPRADTSTSATRMSKRSRTGLAISTRSRFKRENFANLSSQIFLRPTQSLPPAASGALTTPSSKTLSLPRTIGFAESVTMSQIFTPLELWGWSWEPLCSGVLLLLLTCLYVFNLNPLPAPLPTSMDARQASTSGLSPSYSSHPYRSLSATAMSCLLCSR